MQQTTIGEILDDLIRYEGAFSIYLVRDGDLVLYIGKASSVQVRLRSHLGMEWASPSMMGRCVLDNLPQSRSWIVEVYTVEECASIAVSFVQEREGRLPVSVDVDDVEEALIKRHRPCLNIEYNPDPIPLPDSYRRKAVYIERHATQIGEMLGLLGNDEP